MVVNFSVVDDMDVAGFIREGLLSADHIDDRKPRGCQHCVPGMHNGHSIRTAMQHLIDHLADLLVIAVSSDPSEPCACNSTHRRSRFPSERLTA